MARLASAAPNVAASNAACPSAAGPSGAAVAGAAAPGPAAIGAAGLSVADAAPARGVRLRLPLVGATLLLLMIAALALTQGAAEIPMLTALGLLLDRLPLVRVPVEAPAAWERIVLDVRLPRVLAAGAAGAALAYSGAAYQGVFRNPLADPFLLGVASGAALGASIAIVSPLEAGSYGFGWVPVFAFGGAALAVALAYLLSRAGGAGSGTTLILAGVAISSVAVHLFSFCFRK